MGRPAYVYRDRYGKGKDATAKYVLSLVADARHAMQEQHESWFYDVQFARGYQWTYKDRTTGRSMPVPASPWRIRVTDNQVRPLLQHMQALLIEKRPTFKAIARNSEEEDILAAMGFEALIAYDWERLELTAALADVIMWMLTTGNGFWRVAWNPKAGVAELVPVQDGTEFHGGKGTPPPESEDEERDEDSGDGAQIFRLPGQEDATETEEPAEREETFESVFDGDVDVTVPSPFNITVDMTATSLRNAKWMAQEGYIHRDLLAERFGAEAGNVTADTTVNEYQAYDRQLRFDSGASVVTGDDEEMQVRVIEFWEAPTQKHPEGRVITVAGGKVLKQAKNPYGGRFPYMHFPCLPVPGRFWADSIVRELIPLQQMHNKAVSRFHEIMMLSSNPKWVGDKGCGLSETAINDRPGELILKKRGSELKAVPPAPVSPIFPQVMSLSMNAMQTITGVNDPLAGANPPNVRAGVTVKFLQEAGLRRFTPIAMTVEAALRNAGKMLLYLHQRFTTADKAFAILGRDSQPEVWHLRRADVDRIIDVTVAQGSLLPKSPAAQQELLVQLLQYAPMLFQDSSGSFDKEHIFQVLDMPTARANVALKRRQRMRAYQEHIEAVEGEDLRAMPFDDDDLHLQIHDARLSDKTWESENREAFMALFQHRMEHEAQKMQRMMMAAMAGGEAPGGPAGLPGGPMGPTPPGGESPPSGGGTAPASGGGGGIGAPGEGGP